MSSGNSEISIDTISRIFKEISFKDPNTKITRPTLEMASQYIKLFVNEAVLRSNEERVLEGNSLTKVDGIDNIQDTSSQMEDNNVIETQQEKDDEELDPEDLDPDIIEPTTQEQLGASVEVTGNTIDSRHLSKVAGILVLDF